MASLAAVAVPALNAAADAGVKLAQSPVIGIHRRKVKQTRKTVVTEDQSLSVQAWEIGALGFGAGAFALAAGLYQYLTGQSLVAAIEETITNTAPPPQTTLLGTLQDIVTKRPADVSPTGRVI